MKLSNMKNILQERFASTQDKAIAGAIIGIVIICVCMCFVPANVTISESPEVQEAPVPVTVTSTSDPVARVIVAQTDGVLVVGGGVLVGDTLVTSEMLFTKPFKSILVLINEEEITAKLLTKRDGLAALKVGRDDGLEISVGGLEIGEGGTTAVSGRYYSVSAVSHVLNNDNWVLVDGDIPITCTGDPVYRGGELVGVIVGINKTNNEQAIMMNVTGIVEFLAGPMEIPEEVIETPVYQDSYQDSYKPVFLERLFGS